MGESSKVPAVAAVANAVFNALGVRMRALPITRDYMLETERRYRELGRQPAPATKKPRSAGRKKTLEDA